MSWHKTAGVAAFAVALLRIVRAVAQPRPVPLHPDRRWQVRAAAAAHGTLYLGPLGVPLSGWIQHAATEGVAPILWPLGHDLPLVPKSGTVAQIAAAAHRVFAALPAGAILPHVAAAARHALVDRDATLARMGRGARAPTDPGPRPAPGEAAVAAAAALALHAAAAWPAVALWTSAADAPAAGARDGGARGGWSVAGGTLSIAVRPMGAWVGSRFAFWDAAITFDPAAADGPAGRVEVTVQVASLTLGALTEEATGPGFLDAAAHPVATFAATIRRSGGGHVAEGMLTLAGTTAPVAPPFALELDGDTAQVRGAVTLDRRSFGIGSGHEDAEALGFAVPVEVTLTAVRRQAGRRRARPCPRALLRRAAASL